MCFIKCHSISYKEQVKLWYPLQVCAKLIEWRLIFFFHLNIINHNSYNLIHSFLSRCGLHLFYCILLVIVKGLRSTCYITLWSMVSALTSVISRENKKYHRLYRAY